MEGTFVKTFLKNWKTIIVVWILIWLILSLIQIYILKREVTFSVIHSFLISSLISA